jgi:hypothetical protein
MHQILGVREQVGVGLQIVELAPGLDGDDPKQLAVPFDFDRNARIEDLVQDPVDVLAQLRGFDGHSGSFLPVTSLLLTRTPVNRRAYAPFKSETAKRFEPLVEVVEPLDGLDEPLIELNEALVKVDEALVGLDEPLVKIVEPREGSTSLSTRSMSLSLDSTSLSSCSTRVS